MKELVEDEQEELEGTTGIQDAQEKGGKEMLLRLESNSWNRC